MSVLVCENLTKKIKNKEYVKNFSYNFLENQIYTIIEKNDESIHHLLNILTDREKANEGNVWVDGENIEDNKQMVERICYISENMTFPNSFKIKAIFDMMNKTYPKWDYSFAFELSKHFNIDFNTYYAKLKVSQKSILNGIIALAAKANITIMANPLKDAGIKERYDYFNFLYKQHQQYPRTYIISTTFIDEISYLTNKVLFLDNGRLFAHFSIEEMKNNFRYLSGKTEVLKSLINGVKIIGVEERDKILTVCIRQKLSKDEIRKYQKYLIQISEVPIYNIFNYLINLRELKERL